MKQNQIKIIALEPKLDGNLYESNPDNYSFSLITFINMFYQNLELLQVDANANQFHIDDSDCGSFMLKQKRYDIIIMITIHRISHQRQNSHYPNHRPQNWICNQLVTR